MNSVFSLQLTTFLPGGISSLSNKDLALAPPYIFVILLGCLIVILVIIVFIREILKVTARHPLIERTLCVYHRSHKVCCETAVTTKAAAFNAWAAKSVARHALKHATAVGRPPSNRVSTHAARNEEYVAASIRWTRILSALSILVHRIC